MPPQIRVLQGDGMDASKIYELMAAMIKLRLSIDNIAVGMGGGLLQKVDRDTCNYAMKCSAIFIKDSWMDVYKDPKTDHSKKSKKGLLAVIIVDDVYTTVREDSITMTGHRSTQNYLRTIFENGMLLIDDNFSDIRERAAL